MNEYMVQAIGFLGVALFIISYQIRSNRALFLCQLMGCIVFCVQFFLMGAYTGAISLIVNIASKVPQVLGGHEQGGFLLPDPLYRFLVFGVKDLINGSLGVRNAMLFNLLSYLSDKLLTEGHTVAGLDELYIWLSNPTGR